MRLLAVLAVALGLTLAFSGVSSADPQQDNGLKVYVCKYVGTPNVNERLQTGQNPIEVSVNSIKDYQGPGSYFADAQGRSYVLATVPQSPEPSAADCPGGAATPTDTTAPETTIVVRTVTSTEQVPTTVVQWSTETTHETVTVTDTRTETDTATQFVTIDVTQPPTTVTEQETDVSTVQAPTTIEVPVTIDHTVVSKVGVPTKIDVPVTVTKTINGEPKLVTVRLTEPGKTVTERGDDTTVYGATVTVTDCPPGVSTPDAGGPLAYTGTPSGFLIAVGGILFGAGLILLISTSRRLRAGAHTG